MPTTTKKRLSSISSILMEGEERPSKMISTLVKTIGFAFMMLAAFNGVFSSFQADSIRASTENAQDLDAWNAGIDERAAEAVRKGDVDPLYMKRPWKTPTTAEQFDQSAQELRHQVVTSKSDERTQLANLSKAQYNGMATFAGLGVAFYFLGGLYDVFTLVRFRRRTQGAAESAFACIREFDARPTMTAAEAQELFNEKAPSWSRKHAAMKADRIFRVLKDC